MTTRPSSPIADAPPSEERLTDYDQAHLAIYLRLLDAAQENAPWDEVARLVLGIDASTQPHRARHAHESHLARARWLTDHGYRGLLGSASTRPKNEGLS